MTVSQSSEVRRRVPQAPGLFRGEWGRAIEPEVAFDEGEVLDVERHAWGIESQAGHVIAPVQLERQGVGGYPTPRTGPRSRRWGGSGATIGAGRASATSGRTR